LFSGVAEAQHPFKYDHTVYKTVYLPEAFRLMDSLLNYLLLDVRSPGEYADTSRATMLNIGRLKGSVNITIDSVPAHLTELNKYLNQPVFIYCSHSQRSRRVSKLLAENGFKKVYNINGGMTQLNELDANEFPDRKKYLITHLAYTNISSPDAYRLMQDNPDLVIIDIRTEYEFASGDSLQRNNIGHLKNAINIPQTEFAGKLDTYKIPKNSMVLLYDQSGVNSMDVVDILRVKGFTRIYNLFGGLEDFMTDYRLSRNVKDPLIIDAPAFTMLDPKGCIDLLLEQPNIVILDARPAEEFNNVASRTYLNLGHLKGAFHVASLDSLEIILRQKGKSSQFLIYGSSSDMGAMVCREMIKKGYLHVNFLIQGFYHFVWSTANVENCQAGKAFLTDHEGLY
jgi:rhodanese-related sulfurtransferase